jgi:hypothetical protein
MLVLLAVASIGLGNLVAIAQSNLKRMLAYSTISHMGFLVLGILAGNDNGYSSALFYVITYVLMTLASFGMILVLSRAGFEAEELDDFKGLNQKSKWYAFLMMIVMFSLAGLPPTVGFFAKLSVLQAVLDAGYTWLVVYAVLHERRRRVLLPARREAHVHGRAGGRDHDRRARDMRFVLSVNALADPGARDLPGGADGSLRRAITASM